MPALTFAQTGKISGQIREKNTGEPLPGANVVITGTALGAATDAKGYYTILNVPPGSYTLRTTFIGYAKMAISDVRVSINQTTTINFDLKSEAVAGEAVTIVANRPLVEPDVSANVVNVQSEAVEYLPIAGVDRVVTLQAGVEPDMSIRGAPTAQLAYSVDGISLRDGRDNEPFTGVSLTALDEVQIQTGGFNAEYGNARSGVIQVTSKTPSARYTADLFGRYIPAQDMNFDGKPNDPNAYWMRPYFDPAVKGGGTASGAWDTYTRRQYPVFGGWNAFEGVPVKDDFGNELTATAAMMEKIYRYHTRKDFSNQDGHDLDVTVGGPLVPGLSDKLGDLRFLLSYRNVTQPYLYRQNRDAYTTQSTQFKLVASLTPKMKVSGLGLISREKGTAYTDFARLDNSAPILGLTPHYPWEWQGIVSDINDHTGRSTLFAFDRHALTDVDRNVFGVKLTHSLSTKSFYEARLQYSESDYLTGPGEARDLTTVNETIDGYQLNEAPFGWQSAPVTGPGSELRLGGHWARGRDTTNVKLITANFDYTTQFDRVNQIKAGFEIITNDYDFKAGSFDANISHVQRSFQVFNATPWQAALYAQDKLEFKGMIMNLGLRLEYFNPNSDWWVYDPYTRAFSPAKVKTRADEELLSQELDRAAADKQLDLSPRLGVSFPISVVSKLYFNYGHFRQNLDPTSLYEFEERKDGKLGRIGDPSMPFQKTVAYELGYDHSFADQYLVRVSGYYRDLADQPAYITFTSFDASTQYEQRVPFNYSDVRGLELTLNKFSGRWLHGFVTYTYLQTKQGDFGFEQNYQNLVEQTDYLRTTNDNFQNRPIAQPFANLNLEVLVPRDYGTLLGDWRLNLLGEYRSGDYFTWAGPSGATLRGLEQNVQMRDFWNLDLRLSKDLKFGSRRATLFLDINNALNLRYMFFSTAGVPFFNDVNGGPFEGPGNNSSDYDAYMTSLHLNPKVFGDRDISTYTNIPGNDRPGDYRPNNVAFVPIEVAANKAALDGLISGIGALEAGRRVLGYDAAAAKYYELRGGAWVDADQGFVKQVLDSKAYIDMPNETYRTFLNPRAFILGLRLSL
ncbi:TonB-dependent receptor [candidate division KSB1 bacterium]|nr:TonB-dependent receptor [candidate division KSB1 bacterium]